MMSIIRTFYFIMAFIVLCVSLACILNYAYFAGAIWFILATVVYLTGLEITGA